MAEARDIDPATIEASPHNPRLVFDPSDLERLRESIDEVGILVPLTVYEIGGQVKLIDGERRLRCALDLGLAEVPCYVVEGVDEAKELEWMFSIHMMREEWEDGPVAKALRALAQRLGSWDVEKMRAVTGLSTQRLAFYKALADAPEEILERVISGDLPANLIADSILRVAKPLRTDLPDVAGEKSDQQFIQAMVEKRDAGKLEDVVELRNLRTMIRVAAEETSTDEEAEELKNTIARVIDDPETSIEDAYEDTVAPRMAAESFAVSIERFKKSAGHAARQVQDNDEAKAQLALSLRELAEFFESLANELDTRG